MSEKNNKIRGIVEHGFQPKSEQKIEKEGYKPKPQGSTNSSSQSKPPQGGSGVQPSNNQGEKK